MNDQDLNDRLPVLVATAGLDGYYREVNAAFERILGWSQEESLSRPFFEFIHPEDRAAAVETFERLKSGETVTDFVDRNICKDGSWRRINWVVIPVLDRDTVFGIGQDITEKQASEAALRESQRRLSTLMSNLPGMAYRCRNDRDWTMEFVSEGAVQLTGYEASDLTQNRRVAYGDLIQAADRKVVWDQVQRALAERRRFQLEYRIRTAHGEEKWVWEQGVGVLSKEGELQALEGFITDISERNRAQAALKLAHDELEQRVEERTAELAGANRKLVATLESIADGFVSFDREWRYTYVNSAAARFLRKTPEELLGNVAWDVFPEASRLRFHTEFHRAVRENVAVQFEEFYPDPMNAWYECHCYPSSEGLSVYFRDVSSRKQAEQALRHSEERYRTLVEASPDAVVKSELSGRVIFASQKAADLLGFDSAEQMCGRRTSDFIIEEERSQLSANLSDLARVGVRRNTEYTGIRSDGTRFPVEVSSAVIRDDAGSPNAVMAVVRDITQRKRAQQALLESEEKYRILVETCPDAVVMTNLEGRIVFASRQAVELYGAGRAEEMYGLEATSLMAPEERRRARESIARLQREGVHRNLEYTLVRRDGTRFPGELSSAVVRDAAGRPQALMAVARDITRRKEVETALQQSYDQLKTIYDGITEGLVITDIETKRFVQANASMCRMLGYSREELLAASVPDIHPPEEVPNDLNRFQAAADGRVSINEERPVLRKDGGIFYADISGHPIVYEGRPCLLALFRDVTERKQAQEALERERRTLFHMLRASDHERQLISYDIHDGLAQQLAAATMQFQAYDGLKKHDPRKAKTAYDAGVQMVAQAHAEARRLISGVRPPILDESGITAAIAHLVYEHSTPLGPKVEFHSGVKVGRLAKVLENAIYRIAQESLANALQHSGSEKVKVSLMQDNDDLRLEIQDWGAGFDPKLVDENRFGLEGIRERTRLLGGQCSIESKPGKGTCVRVTLPILEQE